MHGPNDNPLVRLADPVTGNPIDPRVVKVTDPDGNPVNPGVPAARRVQQTLGALGARLVVDVTLPAGMTLKDGSAGAAVNVSSGATGIVIGQPGANYLRIVGQAVTTAANNSTINFSIVTEIN